MKNLQLLLFLTIPLFVFCKKKDLSNSKFSVTKSVVKYSKCFDIVNENGVKVLIIKGACNNSNQTLKYIIQHKTQNSKLKTQNSKVIYIPVNKLVATSTTHIPMIESLNEEKSIVGFSDAGYISSKKTRKLIEAGKITEIGKEGALNTEILISLDPELVVAHSVANADKTLLNIKKTGVEVIYNADWLEETPLGRAEWIKFFGVLFDKDKKADSIFNLIEAQYLSTKEIALKRFRKPSVLSGAIMSKGIWSLPAGGSFMAHFFKDANLNYLYKNTKGNGSLSLSFESVFEKANKADFWIAPGHFTTKKQLLKSNKLYAKFQAFKEDKIYTLSKKGITGGVIYYEYSPIRPDLVLKDFIKITNEDLLSDYELSFFEKMK